MKLIKTIDALIKGKTIETITKKWNKILTATNDSDFANWIIEENVAKLNVIKDCGACIDVDWQFENVCYVSLNIYE